MNYNLFIFPSVNIDCKKISIWIFRCEPDPDPNPRKTRILPNTRIRNSGGGVCITFFITAGSENTKSSLICLTEWAEEKTLIKVTFTISWSKDIWVHYLCSYFSYGIDSIVMIDLINKKGFSLPFVLIFLCKHSEV